METTFYYTVGLEVHAELKTASKMFCACKNDPDENEPNKNVCPVCMAHPGTLPVPNIEAIKSVVKVGRAIDANIANFTEFDRKNYFYPDIPKGYQISQYKYPIVSGGKLAGFDITRIHLEEDTGNSKHDKGDFTLVDYNRAGVPLMELVTEPHTFETAEDAAKSASAFAKELQLLLWYLNVSEANMEKGEMRVEANISMTSSKRLSESGLSSSEGLIGRTDLDKFQSALGTKVEVKNLNSFRSVERAMLFEYKRMRDLIEKGKGDEIKQETRGWDEGKQSTFSQRSKENAQDYRYFPDPDIPKYYLQEIFGENFEKVKDEMKKTPEETREDIRNLYPEIKIDDLDFLIVNIHFQSYFKKTLEFLNEKKQIELFVNYFVNDYVNLIRNDESNERSEVLNMTKVSPEYFSDLIKLLAEQKLSSRSAKDILKIMYDGEPSKPLVIAEKHNLIQKHDEGAIKEIVQKVIDANPTVTAEYKAGKESSIQFLVGQVMKESKGSANPQIAMKILKELL